MYPTNWYSSNVFNEHTIQLKIIKLDKQKYENVSFFFFLKSQSLTACPERNEAQIKTKKKMD